MKFNIQLALVVQITFATIAYNKSKSRKKVFRKKILNYDIQKVHKKYSSKFVMLLIVSKSS